jgi:uncharacterized protein
MAGILGYLSILADDISTLAGKTLATTSKSLVSSIDDIGTMFDDIATYTKIAGIKSSSLLVDDLAAISSFTNETTSDILKNELKKAKSVTELKQNIKSLDKKSQEDILNELGKIKAEVIKSAQKAAAARELPIVYKIGKGSLKNKAIIVPIVLVLNFIAPWLIAPLLILGGIYLSFEGVETILERLFHHEDEHNNQKKETLPNKEFEEQKVNSAIKTDFILSFEIIVISLSLLSDASFFIKIIVLIIISILTTVGVYGIVALIIKLDDVGFYLQEKNSQLTKILGDTLIASMPIIIKVISVIGTVAMLAVGGGIVAHQTHLLHHFLELLDSFESYAWLARLITEIIFGLLVGFATVMVVSFIKKFKK